jgi:hypothetical protein
VVTAATSAKEKVNEVTQFNSNVSTPHFMSDSGSRARAKEGIEHKVARIAGDLDNSLQ